MCCRHAHIDLYIAPGCVGLNRAPFPPEWQQASESDNVPGSNGAEAPAATVYAATGPAEGNGKATISAVKTQTVEAKAKSCILALRVYCAVGRRPDGTGEHAH